MVHVYAVRYMAEEPGYARFYILLDLMAAAILLMVAAGDLVTLLVAWHLIGVLLYFLLVMWCIRIAALSRDRFGSVLAIGVGSIFFWHVIINLGMVMGVLPVVGVTLPLFSYGGSSILMFMLCVGLLMNVSIRRFHR